MQIKHHLILAMGDKFNSGAGRSLSCRASRALIALPQSMNIDGLRRVDSNGERQYLPCKAS